MINILKSIILTGVITILVSIPVFAQDVQATVITSDTNTITAEYNNEEYTFDRAEDDTDIYNKGDSITIDLQEDTNNDELTTNDSNTYNVKIQSIDYLDNSITIQKENDFYKFYVDEPRNYYLNEQINITMDQNNSIIDCIVDSQPQVYNTKIDSLQGNTTFLIANGNKYSFENVEGSDGWIVGDRCKVIIQDGRLLEVRPIPLNER